MRLIRKQWWGYTPATNGDTPFCNLDMPPETILNGFGGESHMIMQELVNTTAVFYAMMGFIMPIRDPENPNTFQDIWDDLVDKADDASTTGIFISTSGASTGPTVEAGEVRFEDLANMEVIEDDMQLLDYRKVLSFATNPTGFDRASGSYKPADFVRLRMDGRRRKVSTYSTGVLASVMPNFDDVTLTFPTTTPHATTRAWMWTKYAADMLSTAFNFLMGATDGAGDDPWELAALFMEELLAPPVFEDSAGIWVAPAPRHFGKISWDYSVPGEKKFGTLSAG